MELNQNEVLTREQLKQKMKNKIRGSQQQRSTAHAKAFAELKHEKWIKHQESDEKEGQDEK
tara:strand:- start:3958 stop:4140 length:183 start_codon:yes stop_codon:yes gene_type:complete